MTVAFALSGGGNLGPMQAGSIVALMEAGITPDLLVGTSVGALNAAFLATRPGIAGARALMDAWSALKRPEAVRLNFFTALAGFLGFQEPPRLGPTIAALDPALGGNRSDRRGDRAGRHHHYGRAHRRVCRTHRRWHPGFAGRKLRHSRPVPSSVDRRPLVGGRKLVGESAGPAGAGAWGQCRIHHHDGGSRAAASAPWSDRLGHELSVARDVQRLPRSDCPGHKVGRGRCRECVRRPLIRAGRPDTIQLSQERIALPRVIRANRTVADPA